jgi:DNA-binding MarR family transcriptional regulator
MKPSPAARAPEPLDLNGFLPYRLSLLSARVSRAFARGYESRFGLSIPDWRVLAVLGQEPGLAADDICRRTEMDKATVSRVLVRLEGRRLVKRGIAAHDRRRLALTLTARGRAVYAELVPLARDYEATLAGALDGAERREFDRLLEKLLTAAGASTATATSS